MAALNCEFFFNQESITRTTWNPDFSNFKGKGKFHDFGGSRKWE